MDETVVISNHLVHTSRLIAVAQPGVITKATDGTHMSGLLHERLHQGVDELRVHHGSLRRAGRRGTRKRPSCSAAALMAPLRSEEGTQLLKARSRFKERCVVLLCRVMSHTVWCDGRLILQEHVVVEELGGAQKGSKQGARIRHACTPPSMARYMRTAACRDAVCAYTRTCPSKLVAGTIATKTPQEMSSC